MIGWYLRTKDSKRAFLCDLQVKCDSFRIEKLMEFFKSLNAIRNS